MQLLITFQTTLEMAQSYLSHLAVERKLGFGLSPEETHTVMPIHLSNGVADYPFRMPVFH